MVHEIGAASNLRLENQLSELTSLVRQHLVGQHQPSMRTKVCGICTYVEHHTDLCPTLQETESDQPKSVRAIVWEATIPVKAESRAICSSTIQIVIECTSRTNRISKTDSAISSTTVPTTATIENATSRQFSISRGSDEATCTICELQQHAVLAKYERHHPRPQALPRSTEVDSEPYANSQGKQQEKTIPLSFPTWTVSARKAEFDEELLKMFHKVEINIPLLDTIKLIPKYAKFLKELCVHKRKKMKGSVEVGGIVSALTKNEEVTAGAQALPKKCRDLGIFSVPCTIGECTFVNAMLDLGASINVMSTSIYKALNFGDLEPTGMAIQLENRSVVQPLGILEDVLVEVNELIFPADFYVLDMEDETLGKGSTLILGRPFLMTARTKIDVHA
ncbi:hypothetical protein CR513_36050, partial [Mucuna pruriens]